MTPIPSTQDAPIVLQPLTALALGVGLWAFGIAFGSYLREGDMKLGCDQQHRYTLKGESYRCVAVDSSPAKRANGPY